VFGDEYARGIVALLDIMTFDDPHAAVANHGWDLGFDQATPEGSSDGPAKAVGVIENGPVLSDDDQCEATSGAEDALDLIQGAIDVFAAEEFEQEATDDGIK
jgi:hypothetical protein